MKTFIKSITRGAVRIEFVWAICQSIMKMSQFFHNQRYYITHKEEIENLEAIDREIKHILREPIVKNGAFKGLKYPTYQAYCSAIYPKIIGSYENEISTIIKDISNKNYSEIIDVGCAEGYYAVGLAKINPNAKVYAYDIDINAMEACKRMAALNNVSERVIVESECTSQVLSDFNFTRKGLIICDCEGYEKILFNKTVVENLANCDLIVEVHDFVDYTISTYIENLFSSSHKITIKSSIDDIVKAKTYSFPETEGLDLLTKKLIFSERRPAMEWYYLESKL